MSRIPSAWEQVVGEPAQVSYWKWRVRRLEPLVVLAFVGGLMLGLMFGAALVLSPVS